jgi:hypothetical protein
VEQVKPDEELILQTDTSDIGMSGARFQRYGGQNNKRNQQYRGTTRRTDLKRNTNITTEH